MGDLVHSPIMLDTRMILLAHWWSLLASAWRLSEPALTIIAVISCADADVAFAVDCLTAGGFAVGNSINTASPFACLRCWMAGGFPIKTSAFLVFGFVGIIGGSGMGAGWSCPHIYRHIRYMCHLCSIAIGRQDFRLLTSNGVSTLLYLSYI